MTFGEGFLKFDGMSPSEIAHDANGEVFGHRLRGERVVVTNSGDATKEIP